MCSELERGAEVDGAGVVRVAAGSDERPVEERRSEALPAGEHQRAQLRQRHVQAGVDEVPALDLGVEEAADPGFDGRADDGQAGRDRSQAGGRQVDGIRHRGAP